MPRVPCSNIFCHAKPLTLVLICVQLVLLAVLVLHLRGVFDVSSKWQTGTSTPPLLPKFSKNGPLESIFRLQDNEKNFFENHGKELCLVKGTVAGSSGCRCRDGWHGADCGVPNSVWQAKGLQLERRLQARRIIYAFPIGDFNDLLEIRLQELKDAVDVFIVAETNRSSRGAPLLSELARGWMQELHDHILYVNYDSRRFHPLHILSEEIQHHLSNVRPDDIIIFSSSDEIPTAEALISLRLYNGFPDVLAIYYQQIMHGFFGAPKNLSEYSLVVPSVTTVQYFLNTCKGRGTCIGQQRPTELVVLGSTKHPAGWRCKHCGTERYKHDRSRYHETVVVPLPDFVKQNKKRFAYLLDPKVTFNASIATMTSSAVKVANETKGNVGK